MSQVALAWVSKYSGEDVSSFESLKTGIALCKAVNGVKKDTIRNISTYNGAYKHMANIDNFLKVADKIGISAEDRFKAEDLYYENNLDKVALTILFSLMLLTKNLGLMLFLPLELIIYVVLLLPLKKMVVKRE